MIMASRMALDQEGCFMVLSFVRPNSLPEDAFSSMARMSAALAAYPRARGAVDPTFVVSQRKPANDPNFKCHAGFLFALVSSERQKMASTCGLSESGYHSEFPK